MKQPESSHPSNGDPPAQEISGLETGGTESQPEISKTACPPTPVEVIDRPKPRAQPPTVVLAEMRTGPLPPPDDMAAYGRVYPELPREIMAMAQKSQSHIHDMQRADMQRITEAEAGARAERRTGQLLAAGIALAFLCGAIYLTASGYPGVGGTVGTATVVSLVCIFVLRRYIDGAGIVAGSEENSD
jgi:uncharacterized membrane protein